MKKVFLLLLAIFLLSQTNVYSRQIYKPDSHYQYQIAACLMFQNESFYLKEWIEYHKLIGVEHFYLFNNASTDNYLEILKPYILSGEVELYDYPTVGENQAEHNRIQCCEIYTQALLLASGKAKWLAIIDADEFIVPLKTNSLGEVLKNYERYGGVYVDYLMFGTSHVEKIPSNRLIIETLNHCAQEPLTFGKSIVRPERVSSCTDPHRVWYHPPFVHVDTNFQTFNWTPANVADDKLLLFHYYSGDINHAIHVKYQRRRKWVGIELNTYLEEMEWMNAKLNTVMQRFIPQLKKNIGL